MGEVTQHSWGAVPGEDTEVVGGCAHLTTGSGNWEGISVATKMVPEKNNHWN